METWVGTAWRIEEVAGLPVPEGVGSTLSFPEVGRVAGFSGCNRYTGSLRVDGDRIISLGPLAATRRMCAPEVMDHEQEVLAALARARRLAREGDSLRVFGDDDQALLRLTRTEPAGGPS